MRNKIEQLKMNALRNTAVMVLLLFVFSSCNKTRKGAVVFSFDDQSIKEWVDHSDLFD